jgi:DNA-binding MarR family transcriptional regulator
MSQESVPESIDFLLAQVCRLHHSRARTLLEEFGLFRGQPPLLFALWEKEGLTHSELAEHLHVQPATITKMIKRMERAGFVERSQDAEDQRVSRVYLTDAGRNIRDAVEGVFRKLEEQTFAGFSSEDRALLNQFLLRIRNNLMQEE